MNSYTYIRKGIVALLFVFAIIACEEDFGEVGTGIVGQVNFETDMVDDLDVVAYNINYPEGVQTNGVPVGVLGYYDDAVYGATTSSFLSQVALSRTNPDFGDATVLDSVVFTLPYFSSVIETDEDGNTTYELDSIFKNTGPMKLSAYRSNFFLNDLDPETNFEDPEIYLSNDIGTTIPESILMGELLFEIDNFEPNAEEIVLQTPILDEDGNIPEDPEFEISERLSPSLRIRLDQLEGVLDWDETLLQREGDDVLLNINTFNDFFRGIYLKAESVSGTGSAILFNFGVANVTVYYSFEGDDDSGEVGEPTDDGRGEISLEFSGVSFINYDNSETTHPIFQEGFNATQDTVQGEENLFLKGGDGSIALIDLFGPDFDDDGVADQLEVLRSCNVIINEANLIFFVDQEAVALGSGVDEPERVFMVDFDNNSLLFDGVIDATAGIEGPVSTRTNHLGRLTRETEGDLTSPGVSYRIRITQHVNNIIKNDSTNVRLALAVSQNVSVVNTGVIGGTGSITEAKRTPISSVVSPEGTILHGNLSDDESKRLKLRISYTITEDIDPNSPCGQILGIEE